MSEFRVRENKQAERLTWDYQGEIKMSESFHVAGEAEKEKKHETKKNSIAAKCLNAKLNFLTAKLSGNKTEKFIWREEVIKHENEKNGH